MNLRIVPALSVRPHEIADPAREHRITGRLRDEGMLRDPLIVGAIPDVDGYVLLDGTNRHRALHALGIPLVMVQVIDYADPHAVELRTWSHRASLPLSSLRDAAESIPGIELLEIAPLGVSDALRARETLAVLLDRHRQCGLVRSPDAPSRAEQLRRLVDLYEPQMTRIDAGADEIEERAQLLDHGQARDTTLIAFPSFSRSHVVTMAVRGTLIPAGITRHVILGGRALRVNLPLDVLSLPHDEAVAGQLLEEHLRGLQPRLYSEPTILYDS